MALISKLCAKNKTFSKKYARRMAVYANDFIGAQIYVNGIYEKDHLDILFDFLKTLNIDLKSSIAIDVGANIGNHSLVFSEYFHKVIAFEANPHTFKLLDYNSSHVSNLQVFPFGAGSTQEERYIHEPMYDYGSTKVVDKNTLEQNSTHKICVSVKTLDQMLADIQDIKFIKIDVEGMEADVLNGAEQTIQKNRPIIAFEQHIQDFENPDARETLAIDFLSAKNYNLYWIACERSKAPWVFRKFRNIIELFKGKTIKYNICTSDKIPVQYHPMIIAVPAETQININKHQKNATY